MEKIDKILEVYKKINDELLNSMEFNDKESRLILKLRLIDEIEDSEVKCDEENNPPNVIDSCCIVAKVMWEYGDTGYKYANLVFGEPEQANRVRFENNL